MTTDFPIGAFEHVATPFYYYDTALLRATLAEIKRATAGDAAFHVHYAVKANANPTLLRIIAEAGFGADCVSGGEVKAALAAGFPAEKIVFAGVGKSDWEIRLGIEAGIHSFNVESMPELAVINDLALRAGRRARVALRINPNVDAHTHANITTGLNENKFGLAMEDMEATAKEATSLPGIELVGLHFHIGSQIEDVRTFVPLCERINDLQQRLEKEGIKLPSLNVGGGLGIDYQHPDEHPVPDFAGYFEVFRKHLHLRPGQSLHFELGRSVVGQCGSLVSRVLYVKEGHQKKFLILDAGFTDLIRPALYQAYHKIENLTSCESRKETYDVVGPICESSDVFANGLTLPAGHRGDLVVLRSAGAYGEVMASGYNCRPLPKGYTTEDLCPDVE